MAVSYSDFNLICRFCLNHQASRREIVQKDIDLLKDIFGFQILEGDELPKTICSICAQTVDMIEQFFDQCKRSNHILTNILLEKKNTKNQIQFTDFDDEDVKCQLGHKDHDQDENHEDFDYITASDENKSKQATKGNIKICCPHCNLTFKNRFCLKTHYKITNACRPKEFKLYKCTFCNKECVGLRDKLEHENVHTGQAPYKCSYCPKELKFKSKLKQHIYRHQLKLGLVECKLAYTEKRVHLKLRCNICDKVFSSRSGFQYHTLKHEGKVIQKTSSKNKKHTSTFLCNYCAKSFQIKSNLDAHLRTHTGETPFKCSYCSKEFRQKSALNRHSSSHIDTMKRKLFMCKVCQKNFTTKSHRDIHMRIHTGEKPYECEFCQKTFNYRSQWQIHLRLHTGETPFACGVCSNTYHDKGSLRKHQKKKCHLPIKNDSNLDININSENSDPS